MQGYLEMRSLIQQELMTEETEPACLVAEVKSKVGQLSNANDKRHQVAQVLVQNLIHAV